MGVFGSRTVSKTIGVNSGSASKYNVATGGTPLFATLWADPALPNGRASK